MLNAVPLKNRLRVWIRGLNSTIIRIINNNSSIRNGKFGHYIYYKTNEMTKPKFIKLMGFKGDYKTCVLTELEQWITKCK